MSWTSPTAYPQCSIRFCSVSHGSSADFVSWPSKCMRMTRQNSLESDCFGTLQAFEELLLDSYALKCNHAAEFGYCWVENTGSGASIDFASFCKLPFLFNYLLLERCYQWSHYFRPSSFSLRQPVFWPCWSISNAIITWNHYYVWNLNTHFHLI